MLQQRVIDLQQRVRTPEENAYLKIKARQDVLNDQLEKLTNYRDDLARDLNERTGADREGIEGRLRQTDAQIQQVQNDLMSTSKEVAAAAPPQLAETVQNVYRGYNDDDLIGAGVAGAGIMFALFLPLLYRMFRRRRYVAPGASTGQTPAIGNDRIERMEMAIDSIAVEMERVSENQRFMTRLMTETQLAGTIAAVRGSTEAAKAAAEHPNG
jgi:hypothetical protein